MDDAFSPAERAELQTIIAQAVTAAITAYGLGRRAQRRQFEDAGTDQPPAPQPDVEWRTAATGRYATGTWKRSVVEVIPFRRFHPSEIVNDYGEQLKAEHPTHNHIPSAVANVLKWLCDDGVLAKITTGVYAPAIDGAPIV